MLFPILGIGSLVWFLVRVVPKPSRAAYPCMRVAAPLASTFVICLLGLGTTLLYFRKAKAYFKRSRYITASACLAIGAIVGGVFVSTSHSPTHAAIQANAPIGLAKGANPGRVVWVHDSSVSNWKGLGDGHWWENNHTIQSVVDHMMSRNMRALSGKANDSAAWDTLFRYFNTVHGRGSVGYSRGENSPLKRTSPFATRSPHFAVSTA